MDNRGCFHAASVLTTFLIGSFWAEFQPSTLLRTSSIFADMSGQASYSTTGSRAQLVLESEFSGAFIDAKTRMASLDIPFVEMADPVHQALLEIYVANTLHADESRLLRVISVDFFQVSAHDDAFSGPSCWCVIVGRIDQTKSLPEKRSSAPPADPTPPPARAPDPTAAADPDCFPDKCTPSTPVQPSFARAPLL
jgi:hypothetical protein